MRRLPALALLTGVGGLLLTVGGAAPPVPPGGGVAPPKVGAPPEGEGKGKKAAHAPFAFPADEAGALLREALAPRARRGPLPDPARGPRRVAPPASFEAPEPPLLPAASELPRRGPVRGKHVLRPREVFEEELAGL